MSGLLYWVSFVLMLAAASLQVWAAARWRRARRHLEAEAARRAGEPGGREARIAGALADHGIAAIDTSHGTVEVLCRCHTAMTAVCRTPAGTPVDGAVDPNELMALHLAAVLIEENAL